MNTNEKIAKFFEQFVSDIRKMVTADVLERATAALDGAAVAPKRMGRPPGSKNKPKAKRVKAQVFVDYLRKNPDSRPVEIAAAFGLDRQVVDQAMGRLVKAGKLNRIGVGRYEVKRGTNGHSTHA